MVSVVLVPAVHAREQSAAALAGLRIRSAAGRAGLRGVKRRHRPQFGAVQAAFVFQLPPAFTGAVVEDGSVESGLLPYAAAGLLCGAFGAGGHIHHAQVLDTDEAVIFGEIGSELVCEILAPVCFPSFQFRDLRDGAAQPVAVLALVVLLGVGDLAGFALLQATQPGSLVLGQAWRLDARHRLCGYIGGGGDTEVDAAARSAVRSGSLGPGGDAEGDVPAGPVPRDGGVTNCTSHSAGEAEADPAKFRQAHLGPVPVQLACLNRLPRQRDRQPVPAFLERREPGRVYRVEEVVERRVQLPQHLLAGLRGEFGQRG